MIAIISVSTLLTEITVIRVKSLEIARHRLQCAVLWA